jgi:hypothetical protein
MAAVTAVLAPSPRTGSRHRAAGTARRGGPGSFGGFGGRGRHRATGFGRAACPVQPAAGGRPTPARPGR